MSFIIGVCGSIGSGKSSVARIIHEKYDYTYIDGDLVGHILLEEDNIKKDLIQMFGKQIVSIDNKILRKNIAMIIFVNQSLKRQYEQYIWPKMLDRILDSVKEKTNVILEAALLFSAKWNIYCQETIYVHAPKEQVEKFLQKRNISKILFEKILKSQQEIINQKSLASYRINNSSSLSDLEEKVEEIMNLIQKRRMKKE